MTVSIAGIATAGGSASARPDGAAEWSAAGVVAHRASRLAARFGTVLRTERGHLTQQQLANRAKLDRKSIVRLETGRQRPTAASIWKIARALRSDLRSRVALDERLRACAGESFRDYGRRPHAARERTRLALRLEAGEGLPAAGGDTLGALIVAELAARASGS